MTTINTISYLLGISLGEEFSDLELSISLCDQDNNPITFADGETSKAGSAELGKGFYQFFSDQFPSEFPYALKVSNTATGLLYAVAWFNQQDVGLLQSMSSATITLISPLSTDGCLMTVVQGNDYFFHEGRSFDFNIEGFDLTGATAEWKLVDRQVVSPPVTTKILFIINDGSLTKWILRLELDSTDTDLEVGKKRYSFEIIVTLADGHVITFKSPEKSFVTVIDSLAI